MSETASTKWAHICTRMLLLDVIESRTSERELIETIDPRYYYQSLAEAKLFSRFLQNNWIIDLYKVVSYPTSKTTPSKPA